MRLFLSFIIGTLLAMPATTHADDPLIYVSAFAAGEKGAIHAFRFDSETGALKPQHQTTDVQHPFFLVISPDGRFLYSIDTDKFGGTEDEFVAAYSIEKSTGKLTRLNRQSAKGSASCYLDIDSSGKTVVLANYSSGSVAALPVREDGSLGEAASFVQHEGSSVDPRRQKAPYAHSIVISPDYRFALAADLGIDKVLTYRLDAANSKLTVNETQPSVSVDPGSGPRHLTFHPNGKSVYLINELKNTVTYFSYESASGKLKSQQTISTLPADFDGVTHTADLKITPDGKFLYGTNRGHDSIAAYRIADDGMLSLIRIEPSLGKGPQNLLITPDGKWLLCANMPGNNVVVFRIDSKSGKLTATGEPVTVPMASCIRWLK
ncbi:MAG: lactonase family protein [Planctomycetota bacterium]|nr:lactonase family protein [Planctomycetota bacterium]MDA1159217.1 lactonase family protein [Planctomycetota bacterium]